MAALHDWSRLVTATKAVERNSRRKQKPSATRRTSMLHRELELRSSTTHSKQTKTLKSVIEKQVSGELGLLGGGLLGFFAGGPAGLVSGSGT